MKTIAELFDEKIARDSTKKSQEISETLGQGLAEICDTTYKAGAQSVKDILIEMDLSIQIAEQFLKSSGYDKIEDCEPEKQMMLDLRKTRAKLLKWLGE